MSRTIVDEELKYTVIINGNKAQKELFDLEKAQRSLEASNKDLRAAKAKLISQGKKESDEYKRVTGELRKNNKELDTNKAKQGQLRKELGIGALTMKQLKDEARKLRLQLHNMTPGSPEFKKYEAQLSQVNLRMRELRSGANRTRATLSRFSNSLQSYAIKGASFLAMLAGIGYSIREFLGMTNELSDAQADVAKTTGLTNDQIEELQAKLSQIDTRSSRTELLGLAEEAGRLGKNGVDEIAAFVEVADKIAVSLGDDLQGDVNENIRLIGKLTEQYGVGADAGLSFSDGMTMVGSAINEVSASGSANAGFITDYTKRLVGVSSVTNMAIEDQIGFAAVLDEAGQSVEVSGTAMSKLIMDMAGNIADYAEIAGESEPAFRELFNEDANEAVLRFLEGLNGNNAGLEQMAVKLDALGIDGARAMAVLAALSSQTDKVREKQDLANESLNEATSLSEEFANKNENQAAIIEKIGKSVKDYLVDSKLSKWISSIIVWFGKLVGVVEDTDGSVTAFKEKVAAFARVVIIVATALLSYKAALKLVELWSKRAAAATALQNIQTRLTTVLNMAARGSTLLLAAAKALLTGNITKARQAMMLFNTATKANPIGLLLTVLATAYVAWQMYSDEVNEAAQAHRNIVDAQVAAKKSISDEISQINTLIETAKNENLQRSDRIAAINKLKQIAPEYLGQLELEKIGHIQTTKAIENYIEVLEEKALAEALQAKRAELNNQLLDARASSIEDNVKWYQELWARVQAGGNIVAAEISLTEMGIKARQDEIVAIEGQIEALSEYQQKQLEGGGWNANRADGITSAMARVAQIRAEHARKVIEDRKIAEEKAEKERAEAAEEAAKQYVADMERLNKEVEALRRESLDQEMLQIEDKYAFMLETAKGNEELLAEIRAAKQAEVDALIQTREEEHQQKLLETRRKYNLLSEEERKQLELEELRTAYELELLSEADFQAAKDAIIQQYEDDRRTRDENARRDRLRAYQDEVRTYQDIIGGMASAVASFRDAELARVEEVSRRQEESEEEYTARVEAAEEERAEIMKKYASLELLTKISQVTASTALAVMKAMEIPWPMGPILATAAAATGAGQIAIAKAEYDRVQGYEDGYYPVRDQKGRAFNARRVSNVGTGKVMDPSILVGEKPEIVIDPKTTRYLELNTPHIVDTIYAAANRMKGGAASTASRSSGSNVSVGQSREAMDMSYLNDLTNVVRMLSKQLETPITANVGDDQARNLQRLNDDLEGIERVSRIQRAS